MSEEIQPVPAGTDALTARVADELPIFSYNNAISILNSTDEEPEEIWGGLQLVSGQIQIIIGPSGLGKSRIVLNLAVNQILGRDFAGRPTCKHPLTWLFIGNENTKFRFRKDLKAMCSVLNSNQLEKLGTHLLLPTMEKPDDFDVSLATEGNAEKLARTLVKADADVLVLDPWGEIIDGDELSDRDVRDTIRTIKSVLARRDKPTVAIILNHSLNGIKNFCDAYGPERGNYGKNSKASSSVVRSVWNLRPGTLDTPSNKIEFINAKNSDGELLPPFAVDFDSDTHTYNVDSTFQHNALQLQYEQAVQKGKAAASMTSTERTDAKAFTQEENKQKTLQYLDSLKQPIGLQALNEWLYENLGITKNSISPFKNALQADGLISVVQRRVGGNRSVWTTDKMLEFLRKQPAKMYIPVPPPSTTTTPVVVQDELSGVSAL